MPKDTSKVAKAAGKSIGWRVGKSLRVAGPRT